jgi:hypothetical protein
MMRLICFYIFVFHLLPGSLVAQDPVATAIRNNYWPNRDLAKESLDWSVFTKQYYSVSNWNVSGLSVSVNKGNGKASAVFCRDGIPDFSWYHLYISHYQEFKHFDGFIQLRFSLFDMKGKPPILRLGGNAQTTWTISQAFVMQVTVFDFPHWFFSPATITRGDPSMRFFLSHTPGRLLGLAAGFQIGQSQFGPVTAGISLNINEQVGLTGLFNVLPFGVSIGVSWKVKGYFLKGFLENINGLGSTPTVHFGGPFSKWNN